MNNTVKKKYIIQLDNFYLNELMFTWVYYNQPCTLTILKPKTEGLSAVRITIDNDDAAQFLACLIEKTQCKLYDDNRP